MNRHASTAIACLLGASAMLGLAFASKPIYDAFCRITGFGGTTQRAEATAHTVLDQTVTIRFDTNVARDLPFTFTPLQTSVTQRIGENGLAFYKVTNTSDRPITAVATYNVTPHAAGPFFVKLECFCFNDVLFAPGETKEFPVVFYVDPELVEDGVRGLDTITLSYTYWESRRDGRAPDV